jgi:formate dehydrogenase subunit delta
MQPDKLVMMANQIAAFFAAQGEARARAPDRQITSTILGPAHAREIRPHVAAGGAGLDPLAHAALATLSAKSRVASSCADQ